MIRKALTIALLAIGIQGGAAPAEPPPPVPPGAPSASAAIRCYAHDFRTQCGYWATGTGRLYALRTGAWTARIYRNHQLVWQVGGAFGYSMTVPSLAGDRVEIVIIQQHDCMLPVVDEPLEAGCGGAGPILATEGLELPYLP